MQVALIGVGMVAQTHVEAISATGGNVTLRGVLSSRAASAESFAESVAPLLGYAPRVYADIAQLAADPEIDFVLLCTPPNARIDIVETLARAGKPILMEKPIERDTAAAESIVETCEEAGVPLGMVFQHRFREASEQAAALLASGALGALALVEVRVPNWRPQSYYDELGRGTYARDGGGVLLTQAIHPLDLMLSLTGPVKEVQAMARTSALHQMESEDFVAAGLEFENGAVGSLMASTACHPGGSETLVFHCANGSIALHAGVLSVDWLDGRSETIGQASNGTGGGADPMAFTHNWHKGVIEDFADALAEGRPCRITGREGLNVHRLIDALVTSSDLKCAVTLNAPT